jgi:hypothetical protein
VLIVAAILSLLVHVPLLLWFIDTTFLREVEPPERSPMAVSLFTVAPPDEDELEEEVEEDEEEDEGQIVEIAPPENPERPEEADYLAEYDSTVPEETVDPRYRVDRQVTAETYSPDDAYELEEVQGVDVDRPSTGAMAGREVFREGDFSLFPDRQSLWDFTNKEGLDAPAPSNPSQTRMAGSPSNDWLEVDRSNKTALNSHETLFASWWNRVKQLVSFYADQTLANARPTVPLRRPRYELVLSGLIGSDGSISALEVKQASGIPEFDAAIKEAFQLAAPFPDPPEGAMESDGYVHMDGFGFVITIGAARAELSGIDPRQNVQFPGLQTVPR